MSTTVHRLVAAWLVATLQSPGTILAQPPTNGGGDDGHRRMIELLARTADETMRNSPYFGTGRLEALRSSVAHQTAETPLEERGLLLLQLGREELDRGSVENAIAALSTAFELAPRSAPIARSLVGYWLGLAHLRHGEQQNCVAAHNADSCLFPLRGGGVHIDQASSRQAIHYWQEVLRILPPQTVEYVATQWLLNLAYMTVGEHPSGVPTEVVIPEAAFASEASFPRFPDIAGPLGLDVFDLAGGAIVEDFNGDGRLDILSSSLEPNSSLHLFLSGGDGSFIERTAEANLAGITGGLNMVHADYDNDGDPDVLVLRGAWLLETGRHPNSLLRNNGDATFTDVTFAAGLGDVHYPTQTASWADYDGDGDLDVYIGNESRPQDNFPSQLFRNNDDGTFTDVAPEAGVQNLRFAKGATWGDYDEDGRPDLFVSNFLQENRLFHNDGAGRFTDVAAQAGVNQLRDSFPTWFWDYDNDGHLDLWVGAYQQQSVGPQRLFAVAASLLEIPHKAETDRLYRGDGTGRFTDVSAAMGVDRVTMPMGANFGDLDNDGYLDFYLGTGYPSYDALMPNVLFWNGVGRGGGFVNVSEAAGVGHLQKGHGISFADLDDDGDQDVFEQMGGLYPGDAYRNVLYENPGFGNHWLKVRLIGTRSNRSGVGAKLRLDFVDGDRRRSVYRWVGSGGSFGSNPLTQHLGLGAAESIETLEIYWPVSGLVQSFSGVEVDQMIEVKEGKDSYRLITPRPLRLANDAPPAAGHRHPD